MRNVEKVAELFKKELVDGWERAVVSGVVCDGGGTFDFDISTKVNGAYTQQVRTDCDALALNREIAGEMTDGKEYKFTLVMLPNGEVTVDETGECSFDYEDDTWEKKYLV